MDLCFAAIFTFNCNQLLSFSFGPILYMIKKKKKYADENKIPSSKLKEICFYNLHCNE